MSTPARAAQISSCSTAAARKVSAAQMSGCRPSFLSTLASLPTVVVLPVPFTPTMSQTVGEDAVRSAGRSTPRKTARISSLTRSRRLSPDRTRFLMAATIRSVAGTPTSAEMRSSSSASIVSTSSGLDRRSPASAVRTRSSNRSTICCFVRERLCRIRPNTPIRRSYQVPSVSDRCGRSMSAPTAAAAPTRPSRTDAICAAIGSSTP